jgi:5-histidylcysteine sulfoxide synthase
MTSIHSQPPPPSTDRLTRDALLSYFDSTWALTSTLFDALVEDATLREKPDPLRNPLVFYLGHSAAFYINKLRLVGTEVGLDPSLEEVLARGVDPDRAADLADTTWPEPEVVHDFRERAFHRIRQGITQLDPTSCTKDDPIWALLMALSHERIHFETSSVLIRQLPASEVERPNGWRYAKADAVPQAPIDIDIEATRVRLGRHDRGHFGWDNEYGRLDVDVPAFRVSAHLISNVQYLAFVQSGGYQNDVYWTPVGAAWRDREGLEHPRFWRRHGAEWQYRAMFDWISLPPSWPAEVTCHEAEAYCRWRNGRLPTEAEHHALAQGALTHDVFDADINTNLRFGSPTPVGAFGHAPSGATDVWGNVWQWLSDDFYPLPGFAAHPLYKDFSEPYFDDQHAAMIGGSWASTGTSASRWYRLWFRRHFSQHAGFRIVAT